VQARPHAKTIIIIIIIINNQEIKEAPAGTLL
jgi:hypothetical protein